MCYDCEDVESIENPFLVTCAVCNAHMCSFCCECYSIVAESGCFKCQDIEFKKREAAEEEEEMKKEEETSTWEEDDDEDDTEDEDEDKDFEFEEYIVSDDDTDERKRNIMKMLLEANEITDDEDM
jgi:hypothetical protein